LVDKNFLESSWEEKARKNPLYAVMSSVTFEDKGPDVGEWTEEDLQKLYAKGQLIYDAFVRPVIVRIGLRPEQAFIVEYGSGLGTILKVVKAAGFKCAGIDISSSMLDHSRRLVPEVTNLACLDENGHCNIPDTSAELVYSRAVVHHIRELSRVRTAIAEMGRILKPGGILKMHFRTLSTFPFTNLPLSEKRWVYNFENRSVIVNWKKRPGLPVPLPLIQVVRHTNWVGVPLSIPNVKRFFNENGLFFIGLEQDVGGKEGFVWALARKKSNDPKADASDI
jgi:SAM-dependent methyltransferase